MFRKQTNAMQRGKKYTLNESENLVNDQEQESIRDLHKSANKIANEAKILQFSSYHVTWGNYDTKQDLI